MMNERRIRQEKTVCCYLHKEKYVKELLDEIDKYFTDGRLKYNSYGTDTVGTNPQVNFKIGNYNIYPVYYPRNTEQINRKMTLFAKNPIK